MNYGYIYKSTHVPSGRFYIGQKKCLKSGRVDESYWGSGTIWKNILKKYPRSEFSREILAFAENAEVLNKLEEVYIGDLFETEDMCVNLKSGGNQFIFSEDVKNRIAIANSGKNNGMYGKKHSKETRAKIAQRQLGVEESEETKIKLSSMRKGKDNNMYGVHRYGKDNPMYGRKHTDEVKKRISECNSGEKSWMYGKHISEKLKRSIVLSNSKKILCIETGVIYESAMEAEKQTGTNSNSISHHLRGKYKTAGGFHWSFVGNKNK